MQQPTRAPEQARSTGHNPRSARKSAQKAAGTVPPIANWALKRQLGLGHAKTDPILKTSGEDSRDDSRAGQRTGAAGGPRSDQGDDPADLREERHRGGEAAAKAERITGHLVRPLRPATTVPRDGV